MANVFLKSETILRTALGLLQRELVLPRLVTRMGAAEFVGAKNDTVTLRIPAITTAREYEWRTRNADIVVDELEETSIDVRLDKHPYKAVKVTDEERTLDIVNFAQQVLNPQVRAVAELLESYIAVALRGGTYADEITFDETSSDLAEKDPYRVAVRARRILNRRNVPADGRILLLSPEIEEAFLATDKLVKVDESGSSNALRDATIGRLAGFTVVTSNSLLDSDAYALHASAVAFANMAPSVPEGVQDGSSQTYQGLAMRHIFDYEASRLRNRSVVSSFAGASMVADGRGDDGELNDTVVRAVKINYAGDITSS